MRQRRDPAVARVEPADFRAATRELGLIVAVEVVDVRAMGLKFPGNPGLRQAAREENGAVAGPCGHIRPAAPRLGIAIRRREPHRLIIREHPVLGAVAASDADVGPVVSRLFAGTAIHIKNPAPVWRPVRAEVEVARFRGDLGPVGTIGVARPDLVALGTREMVSNPLAVGTEREAIGKSLAGPRELAWVGSVEPNADDVADVFRTT